ncbi:hypothetical protein GJ496_011883 [Pomphorhynchus laevis]|nr:hypothetical protein GJ496_011883 [Pomphorhynchus laevis]
MACFQIGVKDEPDKMRLNISTQKSDDMLKILFKCSLDNRLVPTTLQLVNLLNAAAFQRPLYKHLEGMCGPKLNENQI